VDKVGRKLKVTHDTDNLSSFTKSTKSPDYARGVGLIEPSSGEDVQSEEDESDDGGIIVLGWGVSNQISVLQEEAEIDLDESAFAGLQ
jgi:hypothetical protein